MASESSLRPDDAGVDAAETGRRLPRWAWRARSARRWQAANQRYLAASQSASDVVGSHGSVSKVVRLVLQSSMLGVGAYLVIQNELMAGAMIAASVMMGRGGWRRSRPAIRQLARLHQRPRQASWRLSEDVGQAGDRRRWGTVLPRPFPPRSKVQGLTIVAPGGRQGPSSAMSGFGLNAGEALGLVGPSAGRKDLAHPCAYRHLAGGPAARSDWMAPAIAQWGRADLGPLCRLHGADDRTVRRGRFAENIARMSLKPDDEAGPSRAARSAGVHDVILRFTVGLWTPGSGNSGAAAFRPASGNGYRARAGALYGDPFPGHSRRAQLQSRQ